MGVLGELYQWRNKTRRTTSLNTLSAAGSSFFNGEMKTKLSRSYFSFYGEIANGQLVRQRKRWWCKCLQQRCLQRNYLIGLLEMVSEARSVMSSLGEETSLGVQPF